MAARARRGPVAYGDGVGAQITAAADETPVTAFIDLVGGGYVELALKLGIATWQDRPDPVSRGGPPNVA